MVNKKNLWCPFCKQFPDKIIERYLEPIEEVRDCNGLVESNIDEVEFEQLCGNCRTKLIFKDE